VGGLSYLRARVILADGSKFPFVKTPGRVSPPSQVNFLLVSRPLKLSQVVGLAYP